MSDADGRVSFETVHFMQEHAKRLNHDIVSGRQVPGFHRSPAAIASTLDGYALAEICSAQATREVP